MSLVPQHLSETYRSLSDEELAALHAQADQLTGEARRALAAEIERRGLTPEKLQELYASALHSEANFDRREKWRRKRVASYLLFRNDPKGTLLVFIAFVVLVLISQLARHHWTWRH